MKKALIVGLSIIALLMVLLQITNAATSSINLTYAETKFEIPNPTLTSSLAFIKAEPALSYPTISIISPKSTVYHNNTIEVLVKVTKLDELYPLITTILYALNESSTFSYKYANFTYIGLVNLPNNKTGHQYIGNATLEGLKEGNYIFKVLYGHGNLTSGGWFTGTSVNFGVDFTVIPTQINNSQNTSIKLILIGVAVLAIVLFAVTFLIKRNKTSSSK